MLLERGGKNQKRVVAGDKQVVACALEKQEGGGREDYRVERIESERWATPQNTFSWNRDVCYLYRESQLSNGKRLLGYWRR